MRKFLIIAWITTGFALLAMLIGHSGEHDLNWRINQISSYATSAPHDRWITAAMLAAVTSLFLLAFLIDKFNALGESAISVLISLVAGAAGAGLLLIARFEEAAPTVALLRTSGYNAIRQQSFHDAGLLIFFFSMLMLVFLVGIAAFRVSKRISDRLMAAAIILLSPIAFGMMRTDWPLWLGITGSVTGLKQRASLFCLWLAIAFTLTLIFQVQRHPKLSD